MLKSSNNGFVAHLVRVRLNVAVDTHVIVHAVLGKLRLSRSRLFFCTTVCCCCNLPNVVPSEAHGDQFIQRRFQIFCWVEKGGGLKVNREVMGGLICCFPRLEYSSRLSVVTLYNP